MSFDWYDDKEEVKKEMDALDSWGGMQGTSAEIYIYLASMAALGITLTFTDEDFIAGRKAFVEKLKRMYESAKKKFKKEK